MPIDPSRESWKPGMSWERAIADIEYIRGLAEEMGGAERIAAFLDPGSFVEAGPLVGAATYDEDGNLRSFTPGAYVMGLGEIGHLLSCNRDGAFCEGYDPKLKLERSQTIMQGASHCDFDYTFEKGD